MPFFEVLVADNRYKSDKPLTYSYDLALFANQVVSLPLQKRLVTGFIVREVGKPPFVAKPIKSVLSKTPIPNNLISLGRWLSEYYSCSLGEAMRQIAPAKPNIRQIEYRAIKEKQNSKLLFSGNLTDDQENAVKKILGGKNTTYLLHGDTATGKTRVYLELAKKTLDSGRSVIVLTPEIALTSQLELSLDGFLNTKVFTFHSHLSASARKKLWLEILESSNPVVVLGPRSALFTPVKNPGLIVLDEAHEPAYKQEQTPRYHANRVASQLGKISGAKVVLGTATPLITDYFIAKEMKAIIRMKQPAIKSSKKVVSEIIDIKDRSNFSRDYYISNQLIESINKALSAKKQAIIYLNRRGTARIVMCKSCGWQMLCPHCDIPLVYHGDSHQVKCHICGYSKSPPLACPTCQNTELRYLSAGTKSIYETITKLFPEAKIARFDSDNKKGERIHEIYDQLKSGKIDILIGTQLLAKGFDLPRLGVVGIISAESSLSMPDFTAEERTFQLLYQVIGRAGRGHSSGKIVIQSYDPNNIIVQSAVTRDWERVYKHLLDERKIFRYPPYSYLARFSCNRSSSTSAERASKELKSIFQKLPGKFEIIGPSPAFYSRKSGRYYWQIVVKSKSRLILLDLCKSVPANWTIDIDPTDLL